MYISSYFRFRISIVFLFCLPCISSGWGTGTERLEFFCQCPGYCAFYRTGCSSVVETDLEVPMSGSINLSSDNFVI